MIHHISTPRFDRKNGIDIFCFGDRQQMPEGTGAGKASGGYIREAWEEFRRDFKASPNPWALGLGDYSDWLRPTMRSALNGALGKDDSAKAMIDTMVLKEHDKIIDEMSFLDRRIIGLHEGHHTHVLMDGTNTDQRLSSALHAKYLGWSATHRLVLRAYGDRGPCRVLTMVSTHGNANGRKVHTALAWLDANFASSWDADIFVMGHGCKSGNMAPFERQTVRRDGPAGVSRSIPRVMVVGGFSRSYTDGWKSDYVERCGMSPQPLGWGVVRIRPNWRKEPALARGVVAGRGHTMNLNVETVNRFFDEQ